MKNLFLTVGLLLFALLNLTSANYVETIPLYGGDYTPVMMKRADLEKSVTYHPGEHALINPGKIYAKPPYIFINERYKGVHIIHNADPAHPLKEAFISAPGCIDMAVKGDILYLDNSVDLVAFHLTNHTVTRRLTNVFPEPPAPDNSYYYGARENDMIIVEWKKTNR
ncbi:MAG: hypothetical protein LBB84_01395 [Tannerellaceae bacterium]|jgi:hypothetical protein|nr:hypothetical protein [Tannerellaceae bacterium]